MEENINNIFEDKSTVPEMLSSIKFASERLKEMKSFIKSVRNPDQTKLVFQTLPKHMRRRTMSHLPKRLPRIYRGAHIAQMRKSGLPSKTKRPSRKYRRKPSNLLKEYIRRQMKHVWLETHIWHAKRFHMTERWGYKLPLAPCDKSFRACYRATSKHCLLQDISYLGSIEITGRIDILKEEFSKISNTKCGLSITAKMYINGLREGQIDLFSQNRFPYKALGTVNFIWKPPTKDENSTRTLWIFAHPSFYSELINELILLFNLENALRVNDIQKHMDIDLKQKNKDATRLKFITKNHSFVRTPRYQNLTTGISLIELKDTMNRFRLTGPLSQAVLNKSLKCTNNLDIEEKNWFTNFIADTQNSEAHHEQQMYWDSLETITTPSELHPHMILALNVEDPRLNRPNKRTKAIPEYKSSSNVNLNTIELPKHSSVSAMWDFDVRNSIVNDMMTTHALCNMREKFCLVPGERCDFENKIQPVPLLLIQRPGSTDSKYKRLGYSCGWDIIVPAGYGLSTWMCLVMWGGRPGGLKETTSVLREAGEDEFMPDTVAGYKEAERIYTNLKTDYFKKPPGKRDNFNKFAIASPFKCPWMELVKEWNNAELNSDAFFVLREKNILSQLEEVLQNKKTLSSLPIIPSDCIVPVILKMDGRGSIGNFSIISLPKRSELRKTVEKRKFYDASPIYEEPIAKDSKDEERSQLRKKHLLLLKRLRNKRVRVKRKAQETSNQKVKIAKANTSDIIKEQYLKMCQLWLPDITKTTIRNQCTREVFGYVTQGDYSFIESKSAAIGYVTINGLIKLINFYKKNNLKNKNYTKVLIREINTRNYRFATIQIKV